MHNRFLMSRFLMLSASCLSLLMLPLAGNAQEAPVPQEYEAQTDAIQPVEASAAWTYPLLRMGGNLAIGVSLYNPNESERTLVAAKVNKMADRVELHSHKREGDVFRMRQVEEIVLPPQSEMILAPMNYHIMVMEMAEPLAAGDAMSLTLHFAETDQSLTLPVEVKPRGNASSHQDHHGHKKHEEMTDHPE